MKKIIIYIASAVALVALAPACNTKPEPLDLQPAYKYTDAYYEALRAYKESDHSICYVWFANYEWASPGCTFMGLPDSVDICNLWGGFPKDPKMVEEMYEMRRLKGTKLMTTKIIRLCPSNNNYINYLSWAKSSQIPSFMEGYQAKYDEVYAERIAAGDDEGKAAAAAENQGILAGRDALRADMNAHPTRTLLSGTEGDDDAVYEYPDWAVYAGNFILNEIKEMDLDGYDLDNEPEGDALTGQCLTTFIQYLGEYIGPMGADPSKLLCIDGGFPATECAKYFNYHVAQSYGGTISDANFNKDGWKNSQLIFTENIGDNWKTGGTMLQQAAFQPSRGGRKGGFGAFHNQRAYTIVGTPGADGATATIPYGHLRKAIQLQNPAVNK
ncbi:MAG: hypothetical protein IJT74_07975 [Bacteroidales bacterium]|nr:hypothetical protein [Bacteroidales bacterium]